jgi:hypothetical protein
MRPFLDHPPNVHRRYQAKECAGRHEIGLHEGISRKERDVAACSHLDDHAKLRSEARRGKCAGAAGGRPPPECRWQRQIGLK